MPGSTSNVHARAFGHASWGPSTATAPNSKRHQAAAASQPEASVHIGPLSATDACTDRQSQQAQQPLPAFVKAKAFSGAKPGYAFKKGSKGVGYYLEAGASDLPGSRPQSELLPGKSGVSKQQEQQQQAKEQEEAGATSDEDMQPVKGVHSY